MDIPLPFDAAGLLAWSWLIFAWAAVQYAPRFGIAQSAEAAVRAAISALVVLCVVDGWGGAAFAAALIAAALSLLAGTLRPWAEDRKLLPLWEIAVPSMWLVAAAWLVEAGTTAAGWLPRTSEGWLAYALLLAAANFYSWVAGSRIVQGTMARMAVTPPDDVLVVARGEARGELIGRLERLILIVLVTQGAFTSLAFLIAAKGFVRSKEFDEDRVFAEYFLIGTLVSLTVGLVLGLGVGALT